MRIISGFEDTRANNEDFAITPFLFGVWVTREIIKVYGLGICWGFYSFFIGIALNIPKQFPSFQIIRKNK